MDATNEGEKSEPTSVFTGIRIRPDQKTWLDTNHINVSALVRDLLDQEIARREGKANGAGATA